MAVTDLQSIGRLPAAGDNAAIAVRDLEAGTAFRFAGRDHRLASDILVGHRFAVSPVDTGEFLTSWGVPFGTATRRIAPGHYLCNPGILEALRIRRLGITLPETANFEDVAPGYRLDPDAFIPGKQVGPAAREAAFDGYRRSGGRGTGTRNYIVILGTNSRTASFARALERRLAGSAAGQGGLDGVVAAAHTEGGESGQPNNRELLLRTLAGFMVHPNVGAVLAVDRSGPGLDNDELRAYLEANGYPLEHVLHHFYRVEGAVDTALDEAEGILRAWLAPVDAMRRSLRPASELTIALQCGGSDAFSGISGNPLAARVAREVIRQGGAAGLAETDELIGAEQYMLANVRDLETARRFLACIEKFKERVAWHGQSVSGNPTGGNKLRGLYNITLKSVGAARKKDPDVRLDHVIEYGQRIAAPGFHFMDSPGNDLESIAGQVASGCNLVFFITGSGSITNFPFVPTVKFMTTTPRFELLQRDMDINAGRYLDGEDMDLLAGESWAYALQVAGGLPSAGESTGQSQVQIWREWRQTGRGGPAAVAGRPAPNGRPVAVEGQAGGQCRIDAWPASRGPALDRVGLIVPTSLCAGQIALRIARQLNAEDRAAGGPSARYVALAHTEGCGASSGENEDLYLRLLAGHLANPMVSDALLLEHGCEHTHNDLFRHALEGHGLDPGRFGWASIQLDGGIEQVGEKVRRWFRERSTDWPAARVQMGLDALSLGMFSTGGDDAAMAAGLGVLTREIITAGGTVVVPDNTPLLRSGAWLQALGMSEAPAAGIAHGAFTPRPGLWIMQAPGRHAVETLSGLGGTGVQLILVHVADAPVQGHPMIPTLQVAARNAESGLFARDLDGIIQPDGRTAAEIGGDLLALVCASASQAYHPKLWAAGFTDFQVTRGWLGVSL